MQSKEDLRDLFATHIDVLHATLKRSPTTARACRLMHTSGTTTEPLPVVYTQRPDWNPVFLGVGERVVMSFGSKPLRLDFIQSYFDEDTPSADVLFMDAAMHQKDSAAVLNTFLPDVFVSPPTTLLRLTASSEPSMCEGVKHIVLAGELVSEVAYTTLQARFPHALITNTYASTEAGEIGVSCERCSRNEFHPFTNVVLEVANPDHEGVGDILVTKKNPGGIAFEQYNIGDVGVLGEHDGKQTITVRGRRGFDYIKLADTLLVREEFDRVAAELARFIFDYKAGVRTVEDHGVPKHHIELFITTSMKDTSEASAVVAKEFSERLFVTPNATLAHAIEQGIFAPLQVTVVDAITHDTIKPQRLYVVHN